MDRFVDNACFAGPGSAIVEEAANGRTLEIHMFRIGHGFDLHRTIRGRPLMLGGVRIPSDFGLRGHSDADVLLHALTDALLGALALGDIGQWFPDTDLTHAGADSGMLLRKVLTDPRTRPWSVVNADTTVLAERPRLAPHTENIRISLAQLLDCPCECVSVKAKTMEGTGVIGEGGAIAAHAVVLVSQE